MKSSLYGIINIGASAFRMIVVEHNKKTTRELDYLIKPLRLGVDTFSQGYISLEHVKQATEILQGFKRKLDEYKIKDYKAVCTSGLREASNKDFFIDYIKIHVGIDLTILDPSEEIYIKYLGVKTMVPNFNKMEKEGVVFANIASGNITLSVTKGNNIIFSGALPYGSLRLKQMFLQIPSNKRYRAFDQYAENMVRTVANHIDSRIKVKNLVGGGSSINMMLRIFKPETDYILGEDLNKLYNKIRTYTKQEIMDDLVLRDDEAEVLIPTICTYIHLLKFTGADRFYFSKIDFPETLTKFYTNRLKDVSFYNRVKNTILYVAEKYNINIEHAKKVAKFAEKLFLELEDIHSLDKDIFQILEIASLLYQVGDYVDTINSLYNSFHIINSISIPGLNVRSLYLSSRVVYNMDSHERDKEAPYMNALTIEETLIINKLTCFLQIASSLDASKTNLIEDFQIVQKDNLVLIQAKVYKEPFVELFTFDKYKKNFEETFGIRIDIRTNINYE